jgi:hypothetical protein
MSVPDPYETDFHAWALAQAALLRSEDQRGRADFARVAEEIEGLARSARQEVEGDLRAALTGLIGIMAGTDPKRRRTLERDVLTALLDAGDGFTPSMREQIDMAALWGRVRKRVRREAELSGEAWTDPGDSCPFSLDQLLVEGAGADQLLALHVLNNVVPDVPPDQGDELREPG